MGRMRCLHCGKVPNRWSKWRASCFACRSKRARAAFATRAAECPHPVPGHEERVAALAARVAAGLRLFEPTPEADRRKGRGNA